MFKVKLFPGSGKTRENPPFSPLYDKDGQWEQGSAGKGVTAMNIEDAIRKHQESLSRLPNVVGVGVGERNGREVILVFVRQKVPESRLSPEERIPRRLEGHPTDVEVELKVG